jgi:casein kinase 1
MNNQQVAIKFESRKSDAPQLRDEYRTYKVLAGISNNFALYISSPKSYILKKKDLFL